MSTRYIRCKYLEPEFEYPEKPLVKLRHAFERDQHNPYYISFLGLALARAEQEWDKASELCEKAIQLKRTEIKFHMNLADVYALAGQRDQTRYLRWITLQNHSANDRRLNRMRSKLVKRRTPLIPFLGRKHFLNRVLGQLRHRILERLDD